MLFNKSLSNRLTLEYTKGEIALVLVSCVMLIILSYFMITGVSPEQSAGYHSEHVRMSR